MTELISLDERPVFRGRLHQVATVASVFGLLWLVRIAPTTEARIAAAIYGLSAVLLYFTSTTYHVFAKADRTRRVMQRLDHSMIYVLIAGTFTPMCVLAMSGPWRWVMLAVVWAGALVGASLKTFTGLRYRRFGFALYLVLGWIGVLALPALLAEPTRFALTLTAGVLYTVGAVLFGLRWPLRASRWFGYHEVWHAFGIVAGVLLYVVNVGIVTSAT